MIFLLAIPYLVFLLFVFISVIISISKGKKESDSLFVSVVLIFSEVIFTIVGPIIGFSRFDEFQPDIPFSKQHVLSIILLVIVSVLVFWIARFFSKTKNPLMRIVLSAGLLQGMLLCIVTSIHFTTFIPMGLIFPFAGFELLSPPVAFFLLLREFYFFNKVELELPELLPYRAELGFVPLPYKLLQLPIFQRLFIYGLIVLIMLILEAFLAYAIGQDIDSIIKAYTHSVGFVFSNSNY